MRSGILRTDVATLRLRADAPFRRKFGGLAALVAQGEEFRGFEVAHNGCGGGPLHPAFQLLLQTLPEPGEEWDVQQRANWLTLANSAFNMIYKAKDGDKQVEIKMKE